MQGRLGRGTLRWATLVGVILLVSFGSVVSAADVIITHFEVTEQSKLNALNRLVPLFEESHPGYQVEVIHAPYPAFIDKLAVLIASGEGPDVLPLTTYLDEGMALNLTPYMTRDRWRLDPIAANFLRTRPEWKDENGNILAIPFGFALPITMYNQDMFQVAGLREPTKAWDSTEWDWSQFVDAARKTTIDVNSDGKIDQYGVDEYDPWPMTWAIWGVKPFDQTTSRFLANTPEGAAALENLADLIWRYRVWPRGSAAGEWSGDFWGGQTALRVSGSHGLFNLNIINSVNFNFDIAPTPRGSQRATYFWVDPLVINGSSKHPDAAWEWMKFLLEPENMKLFVVKGHGKIPANSKLIPWFNAGADGLMESFTGSVLLHGSELDCYQDSPFTGIEGNAGVPGVLNEYVWQPLVEGEASAQQLLEQATPIIEAKLAEYKQNK